MAPQEAFELVEGTPEAGVVFTCEHASEHLPAPYALMGSDARLRGTHWAYDLGVRALTHECAGLLGAPAVLSTFSRLLVDPNREEHHADLFRARADGLPIALNARVDEADRERRLRLYYRPFHAAIDACLARIRPRVLFSIHSFTPLYEGVQREVTLGVLFNREQRLAQLFANELAAHGFSSRENEPWSGRDGLIYSAESHAERFGAHALELEVRQDLACDPSFRARFAPALAAAIRATVLAAQTAT